MPGGAVEIYPMIEASTKGWLDVGEGHQIYWETCGNPLGKPALVVHGGPGSGCTPWHRRLFDPDRYRIILFDQRNCGLSTPHASMKAVDLTHNTTHHLLDDIERLREHLDVEEWLVLGGSWGSTLTLAYAETHPNRILDLILFSVTAGLHREFDRVFRGGLAEQFPEPWRRLREAVGADTNREVVEVTHQLLFSPTERTRRHAAEHWCLWESAISEWPPTQHLLPRFHDPDFALAFARIVTHYVRHYAWLEDEQLIQGISVLAEKRIQLIDGQHDPQRTETTEMLIQRLPLANTIVVPHASHSAGNRDTTEELIRATNRFTD